MTVTEVRRLANVNARSRTLLEDGYTARLLPRLVRDWEGKYPGDYDLVEVTSPEGKAYEVALPQGVLEKAGRICPDDSPGFKSGFAPPGSPHGECEWLDLSGELTAYQDDFNFLRIGSCSCPFWQASEGRYWCKHYLGAPLLLAQERVIALREQLAGATRVVAAMKGGATLRLCGTKAKGGLDREADFG